MLYKISNLFKRDWHLDCDSNIYISIIVTIAFLSQCGLRTHLQLLAVRVNNHAKISINCIFPTKINYWNCKALRFPYILWETCNCLHKIYIKIIALNNKLGLFGFMLFDCIDKMVCSTKSNFFYQNYKIWFFEIFQTLLDNAQQRLIDIWMP